MNYMNNLQKTQLAIVKTEQIAFVEQWLFQLSAQHYAPASIDSYQQAMRAFEKFMEDEQLSTWTQVNRQHLLAYIAKRTDTDKLAKISVHHEITVLKQFFRWLIKQNIIQVNPSIGLRLKYPPKTLPKLVDADLLSQLLDQPPPEKPTDARLWIRDKAMLELLYGSGLRVSELINLNIQDIDKNQFLLRITGKGNKTRVVPVGRQAWQALNHYLPYRELWKKNNDKAVFISERLGTRLTIRTVQHRIKVQARRAGIAQNLYPHLLRHCFASHLLSGSGDLRAVQELLGHSNVNTTQIYTHLDFGHLSKVYDNAHPRSRLKS